MADDRFKMSRNVLATDKVPKTIFGFAIVSERRDYTPEDLAFFRENPEGTTTSRTGAATSCAATCSAATRSRTR